MEFGQLSDTRDVDWSLPHDPALTRLMLAELSLKPPTSAQLSLKPPTSAQLSPKQYEHAQLAPKQLTSAQLSPKQQPPAPAHIYIGSTAWGQKSFVGPVYPAATKPAQFLAAYAAQFNTIELNTTFYRTPDRAQVLKWHRQTPDDFRFCPKVNKSISQAQDLGLHTTRTLDFVKAVQHFEHKLGPCFIQLPSNFSTDRLEVLEAWLEQWPPHLRLAVEFRHASWFGESRGADAFAALLARGIGAVITDVAGRRDAAHMQVTAAFTVVRWVGTVEPSDLPRLEAWAQRIVDWAEQGLAEAYVFTHEPEELPSALAAARFAEFLRKQEKTRALVLRAPQIGDMALTGPLFVR